LIIKLKNKSYEIGAATRVSNSKIGGVFHLSNLCLELHKLANTLILNAEEVDIKIFNGKKEVLDGSVCLFHDIELENNQANLTVGLINESLI